MKDNMKLNFGCGKNDIKEGWINADIQKHPKIDKNFDFNKFPYPFKDSTFSYILAENVIEHLDDVKKVIFELHRISKDKGIIEILVPYYHSMGAHAIDHKHFFTSMTFERIANPEIGAYFEKSPKKMLLLEQQLVPTRLGKLIIFKKLRWLASLVFGEVISHIRVKIKVIK